MIQAFMKSKDNEDILIIGLSNENIKKLEDGLPILRDQVMGAKQKIVIFHGETEDHILRELKSQFKIGKIIDER